MKLFTPRLQVLLTATLLLASKFPADAKSYGSGGGHSYSSHSSSSSHSSFVSHSAPSHSSSSSSHTFSSGSSSRSSETSSGSSHSSSSGSSSSSKSFTSSGAHSYSSGSTHDDSSRRSYSSGKSYGSDSGSLFSSGPRSSTSSSGGSSRPRASTSDDLTFDTAAARARKEETSKETFARYKESQAPKSSRDNFTPAPSAPPVISTATSTRKYRQTVYIPDATTLSTRTIRIETVFQPYYMRPIIRYRDPYNSLFWWWLLDRPTDERALWAYHHRADMDSARYQALLEQDTQLESRVQQLEAQQVAADPDYVPTDLDRDLMYSDEHLQHTYSTRPTTSGSVVFWIFGAITAFCAAYFFIWIVFFKRWQVSPQPST